MALYTEGECMTRTIVIIIEDPQRDRDKIDITALNLIDSIQKTHFDDNILKVSRPGKFCIKIDILRDRM